MRRPSDAHTSRLGDDLATLFSQGALTAAAICFGLWSITPLSWFVAIYEVVHLLWGIHVPSSWLGRLLWQSVVAYACLEVPFSIYLASLVTRIAPHPERRKPFERKLIDKLFRRSLGAGLGDVASEKGELAFETDRRLDFDDPRAKDFRDQMTRWFLGAEWTEVKRENLIEWLAWSLLGGADLVRLRSEGDADAKDLLEFLDRAVDLIEARAGYKFPPGRAEHVKSIRLHLDPLNVASRPLILYALVAALSTATMLKAYRAGFVKARQGDIEYLLRLPKSWNAEQALHDTSHRPLLVLHGLGIGLGQYISVIEALASTPELQHRPVIVLLQPWVSMSIGHRRFLKPPGRVELATALKQALIKHGMDKSGCDVLSHSNGTIVHGWIVKTAPELIKRSIFVDPVAFCLFEPDVPFQFLYRAPRTGIEVLMKYFVASEVGHANLLQRHFEWTDNLLWASEVDGFSDPSRTLIVLSGQDAIVPVPRVKKYLLANGMRDTSDDDGRSAGGLYLDPTAAHGEALMTSRPGSGFERIFIFIARTD